LYAIRAPPVESAIAITDRGDDGHRDKGQRSISDTFDIITIFDDVFVFRNSPYITDTSICTRSTVVAAGVGDDGEGTERG